MMDITNNNLPPCSVGLKVGEACHALTYTNTLKAIYGMKSFSDLSEERQELIAFRSGFAKYFTETDTVCLHHEIYFLQNFSKKFRKCCNIFSSHKGKKPNGDREVLLPLAKELVAVFPDIKPGHKLCKRCMEKAKHDCEYRKINNEDDQNDNRLCSDVDMDRIEQSYELEEKRSSLGRKLNALERSPLVVHSLKRPQKIQVVKSKLIKVTRSLASEMAVVSGLDGEDLSPFPESSSPLQRKELETDSAALCMMMNSLKERFVSDGISHADKVQILTLTPAHWTVHKTMAFFGATKYSVLQARDLVKEGGVMSRPGPRKKRTGIPEEIKQNVISYYQNGEYIRQLPGRKDKISTKWGKESEQKCLLLCTVKELYQHYMTDYPTHKISWASFAALRPRWCVTPGSAGTHNVCVCQHHQNVQLLAKACGIDYHDLVSLMVCDTSNKMCMVHRCKKCPGKKALMKKLQSHFEDHEADDLITYQQWTSTDSTRIDYLSLTVAQFIQEVVEKVDAFSAHSYISKCQAKYLKERKENLKEHECLVLLDFAENFQFVIQDEVQGYHWCKTYCTLHPVVIYIKQDEHEKLVSHSYCFLSDDLTHDTSFVWNLQNTLCSDIKGKFPQIKKLEYFSDGCAGQYKNFKNFLNLTYHVEDFCIDASWTFFATSHGKSPCDGVGGTVKRKLYRESLTRLEGNFILTSQQAFKYCQETMNVLFFHIESKDLVDTRSWLELRYQKGMTLPGTRSFHSYTPDGIGKLSYKRTSEDTKFAGTWLFFEHTPDFKASDFLIGDYVACFYDDFFVGGVCY